MINRIARFTFIAILCAAGLCSLSPCAQGQTAAPADDPKLAAQEKQDCTHNLRLIYDAIQAYQKDHKALPNWLSDLVPQYLTDANVLICPTCRRTGDTEVSQLTDPKLSCSYAYQFSPTTVESDAPDDSARTWREWKRRQMEIVGPVVPIVQCTHHGVTLNLAYDGHIYESTGPWESTLTNRASIDNLTVEKLFVSAAAPSAPVAEAEAKPAKPAKPARTSSTGKRVQINLTPYYNAELTSSWLGGTDDNLATLPTGVQSYLNVKFDVRGLIQLSSTAKATKKFPEEVKDIKIGQMVHRLHFLQAAACVHAPGVDGEQIGSYIVHYTTSKMEVEIPIYYGHDVRDWHMPPGEKKVRGPKVAWSGANPAGITEGYSIRLFTTIWTNVAPDVEIKSIDFVSGMSGPAPFLLGISTD